MNNKTNKINNLTSDLLSNAFIKLLKCATDDINTIVITEGQCIKVFYQNQTYKVCTWDWLYDDVKQMLSDVDYAAHINIDIWLQSTQEGCLNTPEFYIKLVDVLDNIEQVSMLNMALSISSYNNNKEKVFWNTLYSIDNTGIVFGKAIVTAAETFDIETLAQEILYGRLENGITEYNQVPDGMFESVLLPTGKDEEVELFIFRTVE